MNVTSVKNSLIANGITQLSVDIPESWKDFVQCEEWKNLDNELLKALSPDGFLYQILALFYSPIKNIEHIIAIREDPDEEGIWHDDGSRYLAFTLSLTLDHRSIEGGKLFFRKKGEQRAEEFLTPSFGTMTIFQTGTQGYEHRVERVHKGCRIICAGWLT